MTNTIGSSFGPYAERETTPPHDSVPVPAAVSQFPADLLHAPREYAERFLDLRQWREHDRGGHFAALEVPDLVRRGPPHVLSGCGGPAASPYTGVGMPSYRALSCRAR